MDEHDALIERMAEAIAAGRRPPPTRQEVEHHALELPASGDLSIGETAAMFGILPTTIRYYEDAGLLRVGRRENGHRVFDRAALGDLLFVHGMRLSGMPVRDVARLRELLSDAPDDPCGATARGLDEAPRAAARDLLEHHAAQVRLQIARLQIALAVTEHKTDHLIGDER
jgi:DNA-binding transcriptional MerR regulator